MKVFSTTAAIRYARSLFHGQEIGVLIGQCLNELAEYEEFDLSEMVKIIVVEPNDSLADVQKEIPIPILERHSDLAVEHATCFELTYVVSDSGFGIVIYALKSKDSPEDFMNYCREQSQLTIYKKLNLST